MSLSLAGCAHRAPVHSDTWIILQRNKRLTLRLFCMAQDEFGTPRSLGQGLIWSDETRRSTMCIANETPPERRNLVIRFCCDKAYYSDHLPDAPGMSNHRPMPSLTGGYLIDGDLSRPADSSLSLPDVFFNALSRP